MIRVKSKILGTYKSVRRRVGDIFSIDKESEFSSRWMEKVGDDEQETAPRSIGPIKQGNVPDFTPPHREEVGVTEREPVSFSEISEKRRRRKK